MRSRFFMRDESIGGGTWAHARSFLANCHECCGILEAQLLMHHLAIGANEQQGWVGHDGVFTGEIGAFTIFHVHLHVDEVLVEVFAHVGVGECVGGHGAAWTTP